MRSNFAMQSNPCAICLGAIGAGGGQAIFTAECSHTFHFSCISTSVSQGRRVCPLCNAQWRELPSVRPVLLPSSMPPTLPLQPLPRMEPMHGVQPPPPRQQPVPAVQPPPRWSPEPEVFDDDDQVEPPVSDHDGQRREAAAASSGPLVVKTHVEYSAVARDSSHDNFAVLVHVKAPGVVDGEAAAGDAPRAPLDLVTVLDVSGSMRRNKLALVKQAMGFVIDSLGPDDRLCVVSFSSGARRVTRLLRMSDIGKGLASEAVESLTACGGTNIAEGLRTAAKVLGDRRYRNAVSSVILLSDGQDNYNVRRRRESVTNYEVLVPPSFVPTGVGDWSAPIHTFGFGHNHDAAAMHVIAEATGGTFSYIENEEAIQDAFAQCIGGLLTVVVQEARIAIASGHPGVRISSVKSGRYESCVDDDGRSASVAVGELYADEERRFLLFLSVPTAEATDGETPLINVRCSYREAAGGAHVDVTVEDTVVARPEHAAYADRSAEVERERVRVEAVEDIAAARAAAERGAHQEAAAILGSRRRAVARSAAARGGDPTSAALGTELRRMCRRVATRECYRESGRAYVLAGLSSHEQQRATSRQLQPLRHHLADGGGGEAMNSVAAAFLQMPTAVGAGDMEVADVATGLMDYFGGGGPAGEAGTSSAVGAAERVSENEAEATSSYLTPAMRAMLLRSRIAREASAEERQQRKAAEEAGSSESKGVPDQ
ncbi:E3 ubiquitin-protein ligase WAV3 isoform X1 [Setaria viridis]|nr:E3 ubiquitin-protein ligase WAV3-like isoform X1 [Setaria viridis]XP_034571774.1 E3 ubiquitin-protein ligase WAV3-like isoform X1 [Setaria viridis]XP_034571775.1 E3 ubiquitin-protein ligase WAV3-like isoform X1 [Setaria viridis]XP_034571776.1 E3 ubiquitin-protein ligase WAV3-like isoform X1 [Setaria viridis]XP_034571777.1 E3 ubiquitin-protein ligase WAV3-like isoform X1 [Setaria viridis]XP_034571778.1 E3 ubiquitin-protein ligase WAV3-like isoform X1 [Setaria viridis]XP_034571779.1 E3 ubiqu